MLINVSVMVENTLCDMTPFKCRVHWNGVGLLILQSSILLAIHLLILDIVGCLHQANMLHIAWGDVLCRASTACR